MVTHTAAAPPSSSELLKFTPYVVFGAGLILSAVFHRSRNFHALMLLALSALVVALGHRYLSPTALEFSLKAMALLLPLNLVLISYLPESGIFTRAGTIRVGVLVSQAVAVAATGRFYLLPMMALIERRIVQVLPFDNFRGLPHAVLLANAIGFVLLLIQVARRRFRPTDVGIYWALSASFVAFCVAGSVHLASMAFSAGGIVLVIALLETFYAMAYLDELTDLPSRRSFNDAKLKLGNTYTVAMVDVDHFKNFNDTFGHAAGDEVLRMVASRLAEVSGGGKVYRYGGEEFAVLFPGKYVDETFPHLERLRRSIEEIPFKLRAKDRRRANKNGGQKKKSGK